uniref:Uncharacterized protein n=1 Tax=Clytia hemisphaerica TaxID=252671 RepID=A0A7M5WR90_9CNID
MLSLRNLHQPYDKKTIKKKELTVNQIAQTYTLDGLKCSGTSNGFLDHMEFQEKMFLKRFGNGHNTLKSCLSEAANLMSYSSDQSSSVSDGFPSHRNFVKVFRLS